MEVAANWLRRNMPELDTVSVVHGDYRSGNFLFDEQSNQITAWLDWERAHLGDRHRDLAWCTQKVFGHFSEDGQIHYASGLVDVDNFYAQYENASGLSVDLKKLRYYRILNCFQITVATMATSYRVVRLAKSHQDILVARTGGIAPVMIQELRQLLEEII
jgi:aminoglycoside phosphotransferase (APT) family kinase protein